MQWPSWKASRELASCWEKCRNFILYIYVFQGRKSTSFQVMKEAKLHFGGGKAQGFSRSHIISTTLGWYFIGFFKGQKFEKLNYMQKHDLDRVLQLSIYLCYLSTSIYTKGLDIYFLFISSENHCSNFLILKMHTLVKWNLWFKDLLWSFLPRFDGKHGRQAELLLKVDHLSGATLQSHTDPTVFVVFFHLKSWWDKNKAILTRVWLL